MSKYMLKYAKIYAKICQNMLKYVKMTHKIARCYVDPPPYPEIPRICWIQ